MYINIEHNKWKLIFFFLSFHNNKVFFTNDHCSLPLVNIILTLENLGPRVNDSWDSDPSENPGWYQDSSPTRQFLDTTFRDGSPID